MNPTRATMTRRLVRLLSRRGLWIALGVPVSGFIVLCVVASASLLPPSVKHKPLDFYIATTQINVETHAALGSVIISSDPTAFSNQAAVLGNLMDSPEVMALVAQRSGIAQSKIAVDGPVPTYLPIAEQEPTGGKRATELLSEGDLYRLTIDPNLWLPNIGITAQGPTVAGAARLAAGAEEAITSWLTKTEQTAGTAMYGRLEVRPLANITVVGSGHGGVKNLGAFVFMIALTLWSGAVFAVSGVLRNLRVARQVRAWNAQVLGARPVESVMEDAAVRSV
jgi:hypothetical protein